MTLPDIFTGQQYFDTVGWPTGRASGLTPMFKCTVARTKLIFFHSYDRIFKCTNDV